MRCALKRYYPYGQRELLNKDGEYQPKERPRSTARTEGVIARIHAAIALVKERLGTLPQKITARLKAIINASRELGKVLSKDTLYDKCYKVLWHKAETAENGQNEQIETEQESSYFDSVAESLKNSTETQVNPAVSYFPTLMKRCPTQRVDVTNPEHELGGSIDLEAEWELRIKNEELRMGEDFDLLVRSAIQPQLTNDSLQSFPLGEVVEVSGLPTDSDLLNSQEAITNPYSLESAAPPENLISETDESNDLPAPGAKVMRRSHVYRGKTYPQAIAKVLWATGLGVEVITELGGRYRFDLCDWMETWFPLLE